MSYFGLGAGVESGLPQIPDVSKLATEKKGGLIFFTPDAQVAMGTALIPMSFVRDVTNSSDMTVQGNLVFDPLGTIPSNTPEAQSGYETMRGFIDNGYVALLQTSVPTNLLPLAIFTKQPALVAGKAQPGGELGIVGGPDDIIAAAQTLVGAGAPPVPPTACGPGEIGTPPNCAKAPVPVCPPGSTGTPPNCVTPQGNCPPGTVGTPPNCSKPPPPRLQAAIGAGGVLLAVGVVGLIAFSLAKRSERAYVKSYARNRRRRRRAA